ncbi:TPA: tail fiber assembly protein [Salmonella enterica]|uniref:Tail fiber assembly protein n=1 Tax=Salmonella enterica TaxID=28901 RepID=A0A761X420_SALER|nr:tail fiber assembly protein [Salmonella enterica subsp. enterica serovar Bredeney]HAG3448198.1 tail fiber assembly protein [Salmonella enterica]HAG5077065.1 tail fiber assembly protein [Salmonella enterica]HAK8134603.1 tail fiber assembly protein [Salmonella enterica]HAK8272897.1 tail fiber assembly protein [Salmonella enterica]
MSTACVSCQVPDSKIQKSFLQIASEKIVPLQDAVDLGEATDDEKARLLAWKKYRVQVNRVDTSNPVWPEQPA